MRVVSENTDVAMARERAKADACRAVRELVACLMRVVAGASKPYEIELHAASLIIACHTHDQTKPGGDLSIDLAHALDLTTDVAVGISERQAERTRGIELIRQGALRMAAAEILDQRIQVSNGRSCKDPAGG